MPPSRRAIIILKLVVHLALLAPFFWLLELFRNGTLAQQADPVNYITHYTGNWALWILLVTLAITPIRRLSNSLSFLVRFRRLIGLYAFFYASLHLATYIFLFSGYDLPTAFNSLRAGHPGELITQWHTVWPNILDDIRKRRFIQVGFIAWCILLVLAATSPAFIMRAIGGKPWQRLHNLIYLAAFLAIVHFWWLVKPGVRLPMKDTIVLAILLIARIAYIINKKLRESRKPALVKQAS